MWHKRLIAILVSMLWPVAAAADTLTIPNSFTAGTPAQSSQVNANFTAISNLINGNISNSNIKSAAAIAPSKLDLTQAIPILRASGSTCFGAGNTGDTEYRCVVTSDGYLQLGVGSSTAPDIMIKRESGPLVAIRDSADSAYADLKAKALTLSGALSGTSATLSGNLGAVDGTFSGNVSGVGGAFSGAVSGTTGTFSSSLQATALTLTSTPLPISSGGTALGSAGTAGQSIRINSGATAFEYFTPSTLYGVCNGRLTLTTAVPVTTSDVTAATTLYFTPYQGNLVGLYDGSNWSINSFSEISLSLSGATANTNHRVWLYDNSGTLTLELEAWASDTSPTTAYVMTDGVPLKTGALTRRYLGDIRIKATGQCEDAEDFRGVFNAQNRVPRKVRCFDTTNSWTYAGSGTWRSFNNSTTEGVGKVNVLVGMPDNFLMLKALQISNVGAAYYAYVGIGIDSATVNSADLTPLAAPVNTVLPAIAPYEGSTAVGWKSIYPLETSTGGTMTFYGDNGTSLLQSGLTGYTIQ